jgi:tetratricopeptide (TPR) repeat protein
MTAPDPRVGELLDRRYRLLRRLGSGGAGAVYLARHEEMDRLVAVKVLHNDLFPNPAAFARFRREARAAGSLRHPHVVLVHDFGRSEQGEPYLVMEYCDGGSLADRLTASGPLPLAEALRVLEGAASAIDAAHAAGVLHRDLKPANLLFVGGEVKVADFGLAKIFREEDAAVTGTNAMGSPLYMSPEQCQGLPTTAAGDVYSLGIIGHEILAGEPPFGGATIQALLLAHLTQTPPPVGRWLPGFPERAEEVFRVTLAKQPSARYESAGVFVAELAAAVAGVEGLEPLRKVVDPRADRPTLGTRERSTMALDPIGRRAELAQLEAIAEEAAGGAGRLLTLAGEPGTGKSTLAQAFLARLRARHPRALAALGRASEQFASAEPYSPFLDALGHLVREPVARERVVAPLAAIAPSWAAHLPELASAGAVRDELLEGRRSRDRMPRELQALVEELAARQLVVLVLEDLHWADAASIDLLARLAPRLGEQAILIVATYRPADVEIERHPLRSLLATLAQGNLPWTELSPKPFGPDEVASFLRRELGGAPPAELIEFALRRSEGNPLFLLNVLNHLLASGAVEKSGGGVVVRRSLSSVDHTLPEGIAAVLRQKAERLDEGDRKLLEAASVDGEQFTAALVARVTGEDEAEVEERLRDLAARHRLVEPAGELEYPDGTPTHRFRFAHSLYQHAFYDELAPKRRESLHRKAGEALEQFFAARPQAALVPLAVHYEKGREFRRAIEKNLAAAELAGWRNPKDARPHLAKALELARKLPETDSVAERARLLVKLGRHDAETAEFLGDVALYARAEEAISEALLLEPGSLEARTTLGLVHLERGENERAFVDFARVLERSGEHAGAWDGLSYLFKNTGYWQAALACQARAAVDAAYAHSIRRLSVLIYLDRFAEAEEEAAALVRRRPYFAHYNYWRGIAAYYAGRGADARHWIEQAYSLDPDDPIAQGVFAFALATDGERDRARELLASAEPGAAADGTFTYWIAKAYAVLGERTQAIETLGKAAQRGYWDAVWMRKDSVLRPLHGDLDFEAAVDEIAARRAQFERFLEAEAPSAIRAVLG